MRLSESVCKMSAEGAGNDARRHDDLRVESHEHTHRLPGIQSRGLPRAATAIHTLGLSSAERIPTSSTRITIMTAASPVAVAQTPIIGRARRKAENMEDSRGRSKHTWVSGLAGGCEGRWQHPC